MKRYLFDSHPCVRALMTFGAAMLLVGCSAPSPFDDDLYPAKVRTTPIVTPTVRRAQPVADPRTLFDGQETLDLDALANAVLRRNPSIAAMEATWRSVRAKFPQVTSLDDPMLSYAIAPGTFGNDEIDDGHRIDLSQKFPWPGKLDLRGRIARREAEAAGHNIETVRQRLIQETARAYFDYYYVFRAIDINHINIELLKEFQRIAETKYAAGTASKQDPLQAEVERYHLEHRAIVLERMRKVAAARINTLLHRAPELALPSPLQQADTPGARPELATLRTRAVNARPELQSLARQLEAKQAARQLARKQYYPDFTVMGTYNSLWQNEEQRWLIGAGINIPLQVDRRRGAEMEALAQSNRVAAELVAGVDEVAFEVAQAYEMLVESEHVVRLYNEKFKPVAEENLKAARSGYETGKNDFLTLLNAEKNLMLVQLAYQQALTEYHQRWADLERAVGGDIETPSTQPGQPDQPDPQPKGDPNHE